MDKDILNLFIDSNIWLDLYHFSANDLEEFSKLNDFINKKIILYMPTQVIFEIKRNRDNKISDAYKKFQDFKIEIPNFCKGYNEYTSFLMIYDNLEKLHKELVKKVKDDYAVFKLPADKIINDIALLANQIDDAPDIIKKAELRIKRGNPPGKNNSLGDAIVWETLLKEVPNEEDLFFISGDKDYRNQLTDDFNYFLENEWEKQKKSKIIFYTNLRSFFNEHQKDISLMTENEKDNYIDLLSLSGSFRATHEIIGILNNYEYFNDDQLNKLINIAVDNRQVGAIIKDNDVLSFFKKIVKGRIDVIDINEHNKDLLIELEVIPF